MKEQKKSNRVSWASGANLCQVKFFQSADFPSKVGLEAHEHPHLEASNSNLVFSDGYPPSYVTPLTGHTNSLNEKIKHIPQIGWRSPPTFVLKSYWHVTAGEESEDAEVQKSRETRVLEAVYPRLSAIPSSPFISTDVEDQCYDDRHTPVIPIIPIEEAAVTDLPSLKTAPVEVSMALQQQNILAGPSASETLKTPPCKSPFSPEPAHNERSAFLTVHGLEVDPVVAAAAAATAIMKSKDPGSSIDPNLLIKFLSHPKMTRELINEHGLATNSRSGTSELEVFEPKVPLLSSQSNLLIKNFSDESGNYSDTGTQAIHRPLTVKQSVVAHMKTVAVAATGEPDSTSGPKAVESSVSLLNLTPDLFARKSANENIEALKTGSSTAVKKTLAANSKIGTASGATRAIPSVSLLGITQDSLSKKSTSELCQTTNTGSGIQAVPVPVPVPGEQSIVPNTVTGDASKLSFPSTSIDFLSKKSTADECQLANNGSVPTLKPVTQSPVTTNTETGTGSAAKPGKASVSFPSSTSYFPSKKSTCGYRQLTNNSNVVVQKPVTQPLAARTETGSGSGHKAGPPPVSLPSSSPDLPGVKPRSECNVQAMARNMNVPWALKQSPAANTINGTGCEQMPTTVSLPTLGSMPDFFTKNPISEHHELANSAIRGAVIRKQPLPMERMKSELLVNKLVNAHGASHAGAAPNFGSLPVAKSTPFIRPELDISRAKKLIDEHGAHNHVGNAHVAGVQPLMLNQSRPDLEVIKKMISEYGPHNKLKNRFPGLEPLPTQKLDKLAPLGKNTVPTELLQTDACTSPVPMAFTPAPLQKDLSYYKSLIKQHGDAQDNWDHQPSEYNKPQNYLQGLESKVNSKAKSQKLCLFFNSSKGCRNGSKCPYLHDASKQWRSADILEAPGGKRMKSGEELAGRI